MNEYILELWGEIGSKDYWRDLPVHKNRSRVSFESVYVPFSERWPQPRFIGKGYFDSKVRVLVIGQNPRASNNPGAIRGDEEMFDLIRRHSRSRSTESLQDLFSMMRRFMSGNGYGAPWGVVEDMETHIHLNLDGIAYLNVIPLATLDNTLNLATCKYAYERSTKRQIETLEPQKVLFHGRAPYDKFHEWDNTRDQWDTNYLARRYRNVICDPARFAEVKEWLRTEKR